MTTHSNQSHNNPKKPQKGQMANDALGDSSLSATQAMEKPLSMVSSPIIMTDSNNVVVFCNSCADDLFQRYESSFVSTVPGFQAHSIVGLNMSRIPQTTLNTDSSTPSMSDTYKSQVNLNGQVFTLLSTPLIEAGVHQGTLIEWIDDSQGHEADDVVSMFDSLNKVQGIIQFELDGTIITANSNFVGLTGYDLEEIKGQHHSMFVDEATKSSQEYKQFWERLASGEAISAEFKRIGKDGKEIWINASYNPVFDNNGKAYKVVKFATDITAEKAESVNNIRIRNSLDKAGANVIVTGPEFTIDYMNDSIQKMFKDAESQLKQDLPQFDANNLFGKSMDVFHVNPEHQRGLMENLTEPHTAEVVVGGIAFRIITTPIFD
ncbi:MAG: PAS domain-containing protein, partial [Sinobacterium sp.]|nr:PAS domain-containing protein [Sinobacterium sp.]